jgi:hypothetical protein
MRETLTCEASRVSGTEAPVPYLGVHGPNNGIDTCTGDSLALTLAATYAAGPQFQRIHTT